MVLFAYLPRKSLRLPVISKNWAKPNWALVPTLCVGTPLGRFASRVVAVCSRFSGAITEHDYAGLLMNYRIKKS